MTPLKEALTVLADVLAKRPAEEILFDWFRSGRLVGELSVLIKRRHSEVQAEVNRVYQEHLAQQAPAGRTRRGTRACPLAAGASSRKTQQAHPDCSRRPRHRSGRMPAASLRAIIR